MKTVRELHDKATELSGRAYVARIHGNLDEARELARQALPYEIEAADRVAGQLDNEPTRAVLHRSAASLAMQCGEWDEAERLIERGLAGKPPHLIADQLRELLDEVRKLRSKEESTSLAQSKSQPG